MRQTYGKYLPNGTMKYSISFQVWKYIYGFINIFFHYFLLSFFLILRSATNLWKYLPNGTMKYIANDNIALPNSFVCIAARCTFTILCQIVMKIYIAARHPCGIIAQGCFCFQNVPLKLKSHMRSKQCAIKIEITVGQFYGI